VGCDEHRDKLTVVKGDIRAWNPSHAFPGQKWGRSLDVIYFDIWGNQSTDDLKDMAELHKRFRPYLAKGGWMESWNRDFLRERRRQGY
jgi:hypothetical protein